MQVKILIRANPTAIKYPRYHGLSIDEPLDRQFWETQPDKIVTISSRAWYEFFYRDLPEGEHYLIYGNSEYSSASGVMWSTNIAVNDSLLAEEIPVDIYNPLRVNFYVGEPPPPPKKFNWWWLLLMLTAVIEGIVYSQSERKEEENWRKERW